MGTELQSSPKPTPTIPKDLQGIVRVGVLANHEVPGSVALGGTVCSLFAGHRLSQDIDFGMTDLRNRFDEVREKLLNVEGWKEARAQAPTLLLGSLHGVEIGFRQLRRNTPMETIEFSTESGPLIVPTFDELLVTKAYLISARNYTRDFVDFAELASLVSSKAVAESLTQIDRKFAWEKQPGILLNVMKSLMATAPHDGETHGFETFRWLSPKLKSWEQVQEKCREVGAILSRRVLEPPDRQEEGKELDPGDEGVEQ